MKPIITPRIPDNPDLRAIGHDLLMEQIYWTDKRIFTFFIVSLIYVLALFSLIHFHKKKSNNALGDPLVKYHTLHTAVSIVLGIVIAFQLNLLDDSHRHWLGVSPETNGGLASIGVIALIYWSIQLVIYFHRRENKK